MANEAEKLQKRLEKVIAKSFGKRCITKDLVDFPELEQQGARCHTCIAYEELDHFMVELTRKLKLNAT